VLGFTPTLGQSGVATELDPRVEKTDKGEWELSWKELDPCIERR